MPQRKATLLTPPISVKNGNGGAAIPARRFVKKDTVDGDTVILTAASTDPALGVTMNQIEIGRYGDCQTNGIAVVDSGGAFAAGAKVMPDATGKAILWVGAGGNAHSGTAKNTANGADEQIEIILSAPNNYGAT